MTYLNYNVFKLLHILPYYDIQVADAWASPSVRNMFYASEVFFIK